MISINVYSIIEFEFPVSCPHCLLLYFLMAPASFHFPTSPQTQVLGRVKVALGVKNPPTSAGDIDSNPEFRRSLEKGMATQSSILAWKIPWTEKPEDCSSQGCKESDLTEAT